MKAKKLFCFIPAGQEHKRVYNKKKEKMEHLVGHISTKVTACNSWQEPGSQISVSNKERVYKKNNNLSYTRNLQPKNHEGTRNIKHWFHLN